MELGEPGLRQHRPQARRTHGLAPWREVLGRYGKIQRRWSFFPSAAQAANTPASEVPLFDASLREKCGRRTICVPDQLLRSLGGRIAAPRARTAPVLACDGRTYRRGGSESGSGTEILAIPVNLPAYGSRVLQMTKSASK